jgi:hypothetical protein
MSVLAFQIGDFLVSTGVPAAVEGSVEPYFHDPVGQHFAHQVAGKAKHVQIVVPAADFRA